MKTSLRLFGQHFLPLILLTTVLPTTVVYAFTDLQTRLMAPTQSTASVIKDYNLIRLWGLDDEKSLENELAMDNPEALSQGAILKNRRREVIKQPLCSKTFAYFRNGAIESNETLVIKKVLNDVKPNKFVQFLARAEKGLELIHTNYPNYTPPAPDLTPESNEKLEEALANPENRKSIYQASSLLEVKKSKQGRYYLNSVDYTIGGWFKPRFSANSMTLFSKQFSDLYGQNSILEWKLIFIGNAIYFHNFREGGYTTSKYLSLQQASDFRSTHADYYDVKDHYDDVLQKPVFGKTKSSILSAYPIQKIFLESPIAPESKKPPGGIVPPITPEPPSPEIPIPPGPVPYPPLPPYTPIPPGSGKEYTALFDMKKFWHASVLGACYTCQQPNKSREAWYYLSLSVHLNDPLGPYVDLVMILDPNDRIFGNSATFKNNYRVARWELDREMLSRKPLTPFTSTGKIEYACSSETSCVKSTLQIGDLDQNQGYWGHMRGVYIAKKALRPEQMLEMASQYYPRDTEQCTYTDKVP